MQHGTVLIIMRLDFLMVSYYSYFLHFGFLHCSMCKTWKKSDGAIIFVLQ